MPAKLSYTTNARIKQHIRALWLRSRERAARLKLDNYTCQCCGVKQSTAKGKEQKVEVHHLIPIDWDVINEALRKTILVNPEFLMTVCPTCHKTIEGDRREEQKKKKISQAICKSSKTRRQRKG